MEDNRSPSADSPQQSLLGEEEEKSPEIQAAKNTPAKTQAKKPSPAPKVASEKAKLQEQLITEDGGSQPPSQKQPNAQTETPSEGAPEDEAIPPENQVQELGLDKSGAWIVDGTGSRKDLSPKEWHKELIKVLKDKPA